jgi:succinate-acetate transporter protein
MTTGITESGSAALVMSYGMFHGGFVQLIAGTFELVKGNTFAAVAFMSYGMTAHTQKRGIQHVEVLTAVMIFANASHASPQVVSGWALRYWIFYC